MQAEGAIVGMSLEGPSQHRGALAHADDPVPAAGRRSVRGGRIRYFNLNRVRLEPAIGTSVFEELKDRGHDLDIAPAWSEGFMCAAERNLDSGVLEAGCDPRGTKSEVFPSCALAI